MRSCLEREPGFVDAEQYRLFHGIAYTWRVEIDALVEELQLLLEYGFDPNVRDAETGKTPLMLFASTDRPNHQTEDALLRLFPVLLDGGAEIYAQHLKHGATALAHAAGCGATDIVDRLLERGADPYLPVDRPHGQPSAWAEREGHLQLVRRLAVDMPRE